MMLKLKQRLMEWTVLPGNQRMLPGDGAQLGSMVSQSFIAHGSINAVGSLRVKKLLYCTVLHWN